MSTNERPKISDLMSSLASAPVDHLQQMVVDDIIVMAGELADGLNGQPEFEWAWNGPSVWEWPVDELECAIGMAWSAGARGQNLVWDVFEAWQAWATAVFDCRTDGHYFVDEDPGDPETGPRPSVVCARCGEAA